MKRSCNYAFTDYLTYREDMARDIGARFFGNKGSDAEGAAVEPLIDLIKEIWVIDREGVMAFFSKYKDDPRTEGTKIADLIEELRSGKSRVSGLFRKNAASEPDQIVPPEADMDGGEGM